MLALIIFLTCIFVALGTGVVAGWSDLRTMTIPNQHSLIVGGSFLVAYALLWLLGREDVFGPFLVHLLTGLVVFVLTAILFGLRVIGGGDSKLATVFALWVGLRGVMPFLFYTAVAGAVLGLAALALRKWRPFKAPKAGSWVARVQAGESKVPYGAAIACGALASFVILRYFSPEVLGSFVLS